MPIGRELKRRTKAAVAPLVYLAIAGFFAWSATQGNHGLVASAQRQALLTQAEAEHRAAQTDHDGWERRVSGLRANRLDPDTLDERARAQLNLADPTDVIVPFDGKARLF